MNPVLVADWKRQFEQIGPTQLRLLVDGYSGDIRRYAIQWLSEQERDERARNEDSQTSQMRLALSANRAAWIAAIAAIIAAVFAIISTIIAIVK